MSKTVFVGLSGGVDSATSAALLQQQGFNVVGAFIKIWQPEFIECTWAKDRLDAMRVAAALGIPFREIDLSDEYKKDVVEKMITAYQSGETPNPDVMCNTSIKFGAFADWAKESGADMVATGHYARSRVGESGAELLRGADESKDQSYFLYQMTSDILARTIFPVGVLQKSKVRALAQQFKLSVAAKSDSQGLCFVGDVSMRDFLRRYISVEAGPVLDAQGAVIGSHDGAALYTRGQRHGFEVHTAQETRPYYVIATQVADNTITVSPNRADAECRKAYARSVHWISGSRPAFSDMLAQLRYREAPVPVHISDFAEGIEINLTEPRIASPGQSVVFYSGDVCLGGGTITRH